MEQKKMVFETPEQIKEYFISQIKSGKKIKEEEVMKMCYSIFMSDEEMADLIDEILSVGDQHFQEKCINKMKELKQEGKTMVFVTHSLDTVENLCNRAVWLHNGKIKIDGEPKIVISEYLKETT